MHLKDELIAVETVATKTTPGENDGMPRASGISDKTGNGAANMADIYNRLNNAMIKMVDYRRSVHDNIMKLPSKEYEVIYERYFKYKKWEDIAVDMHYTSQHIHRLKRKAIKHLSEITGLAIG